MNSLNIKARSTKNNLNRVFFLISFCYLFLLFLCLRRESIVVPSFEIYFIQIISLLLYLCIPNISLIERKKLHYVIFFVQIIFGSVLFIYYDIKGFPYGYDAHDSYWYEKVIVQSQDLRFFELFKFLNKQSIEIFDYGFLLVRYLIGCLTDNISIQNYLLLIINCVCISLSAKRLGSISAYFLDNYFVKIIMLLWGVNAFSIYINPSGLKENIFIFFIVSSFYYFQKFNETKKINNLFYFFGCLIIIIFFRIYIAISILFLFLFQKVFLLKKVEKFLPLALTTLIASGVLLSVIISYFNIDNQLLNKALSVQVYRSGGQMGMLTNFISAWIGPFPSLLKVNQTAPLIYATGNLVKMVFSIYFILGLYIVFKNEIIKLYPYAIYCVFNIFLIIVSNTALDMRFQYTMLPFFFLISIVGFKHYMRSSMLVLFTYAGFIMCPLILLYNFR
jgi:hypothetical protein